MRTTAMRTTSTLNTKVIKQMEPASWLKAAVHWDRFLKLMSTTARTEKTTAMRTTAMRTTSTLNTKVIKQMEPASWLKAAMRCDESTATAKTAKTMRMTAKTTLNTKTSAEGASNGGERTRMGRAMTVMNGRVMHQA